MSSRKLHIAAATAVVFGVVVALALRGREVAPRPGSTAQQPSAVRAGAVPRRIICMAPNIAETVFALGAGERVVGVSEYTVYPPEAAARPTVGALFNPDLERIAALKPDLIIVQQKHEKVEAFSAKLGIPVMVVHMTRLASILDGIRALGARLDCSARAEELCAEIVAQVAAVRKRSEGKDRVKVFVCLERTPGSLKGLFTVGAESFLSEMIEAAGGKNVFDDVPRDYPQVSAEALVARAPEVIVETAPSQHLSEAEMRQRVEDWQAMPTLPAVRQGCIYFLTDDYIVVPGPRVGRIAERFAELLHPEKAK